MVAMIDLLENHQKNHRNHCFFVYWISSPSRYDAICLGRKAADCWTMSPMAQGMQVIPNEMGVGNGVRLLEMYLIYGWLKHYLDPTFETNREIEFRCLTVDLIGVWLEMRVQDKW